MKTDREYIATGINKVGNAMLRLEERGEHASFSEGMAWAMEWIQEAFETEHGFRKGEYLVQKMTPEARSRFDELMARIRPELEERMAGLPLKVRKRLMTRRVNSQNAESVINLYLSESGLNYSVSMMTYKASVYVSLDKRKTARFHVCYSRIYDDMDKLIAAVDALKVIIEDFGSGFRVK